MLYTIHQNEITFSADTAGAELHSLKLGEREYLWQCGDAWKRYAPVLFPFICSPQNRTYRADGQSYTMKANHGFARDLEFQLTAQSADSLTFTLTQNPETLAQYPYAFRFTVRYEALPDGVRVVHVVENPDAKPIYFYIGGHPAFHWGEAFTDYYVEYEKPERITKLIDGRETVLLDNERELPMTRSLFDHDSLVLPDPNSTWVALKARNSVHSVTLTFPESKCITVWSPTGDDRAAFVCLEPWTSVPTDYDDAYPDIEQKPHAIALAPGGEFRYAYEIHLK